MGGVFGACGVPTRLLRNDSKSLSWESRDVFRKLVEGVAGVTLTVGGVESTGKRAEVDRYSGIRCEEAVE